MGVLIPQRVKKVVFKDYLKHFKEESYKEFESIKSQKTLNIVDWDKCENQSGILRYDGLIANIDNFLVESEQNERKKELEKAGANITQELNESGGEGGEIKHEERHDDSDGFFIIIQLS